MAITKAKKKDILTKLEGIKKDSEAIVFVSFKGVTVKDTTAMRRKMREAGVGYFVAKKTLMTRAFADTYTGEMPVLDGEIAVAYSADAIAPAQNVKDFAKQFKDKIAIVGGVFQGAWKSKEEMTEIASIPSLQVLRGMFVNILNSPIQGLVIGLKAIADKKSA
jgi:large subunit ribosomal protein L10